MKSALERMDKELKNTSNLSIVDLIDAIISYAYQFRTSDIHIDPGENELRLRIRIDGVLNTTHTLPKNIHSEIVSRIKVLAKLRTDEHQSPQDGRFRVPFPDNGFVDIRVSIVPTYHGENVVMRLLTDNDEEYSLKALGYLKAEEEKLVKAIKRPNGMILVTGPTGSGKTTTLYTLMKMLNTNDISLITIEDPIEYSIKGITQIQTNSNRGLTFSSGLRSVLRQDPDIIMVGEIRDAETAGIAINSALTGHLLLSTLHTSDSATTLPRLLDMGIEPYLVASTMSVILAQRLVRKNCSHCSTENLLTDAEKNSLRDIIPDKVLEALTKQSTGAGCEKCNNTGFLGRTSLNEVLTVNDDIREAILNKASSTVIRRLAIESGMVPILIDGCRKIERGETTIAEVLRVVSD
jgi:type II secretory ATPase GspE/PulE/Tfp pilus assembly ATPase PilB-like protein